MTASIAAAGCVATAATVPAVLLGAAAAVFAAGAAVVLVGGAVAVAAGAAVVLVGAAGAAAVRLLVFLRLLPVRASSWLQASSSVSSAKFAALLS